MKKISLRFKTESGRRYTIVKEGSFWIPYYQDERGQTIREIPYGGRGYSDLASAIYSLEYGFVVNADFAAKRGAIWHCSGRGDGSGWNEPLKQLSELLRGE